MLTFHFINHLISARSICVTSVVAILWNRLSCMPMCALHVHAFVLNSSEHSGSQLRSSKQPSVAQLNPFPSHPYPPPLFLVRQKDSCALQRAMFWVVEQGARPAQQLRLCIYIISGYFIPSSPLTLVWSVLPLHSLPVLRSLWIWF